MKKRVIGLYTDIYLENKADSQVSVLENRVHYQYIGMNLGV